MEGLQIPIPTPLQFVGWIGDFDKICAGTRIDLETRSNLLEGMQKLGVVMNRRLLTECVYVGQSTDKYFAYWFGTDSGKNYVIVLEFDNAPWVSKLYKD